MKKTRLISIITVTLLIVFVLTTNVFAIKGVLNTIEPNTSNTNELTKAGNKVIGIIQVVGTLIAVGMVLVLGIKYMMGSAEEKAANKKSMIPYLIGAGLLFVGVQVVKIIYDFTTGLQ